MKLYNPHCDGPAALAWEALRRNGDFKDVIQLFREAPIKGRKRRLCGYFEGKGAALVFAARYLLLGEKRFSLSLETAWPQCPKNFKASFEKALDTEGVFRHLAPPSGLTQALLLDEPSANAQRELNEILRQIEGALPTHDVILVPRHIRLAKNAALKQIGGYECRIIEF